MNKESSSFTRLSSPRWPTVVTILDMVGGSVLGQSAVRREGWPSYTVPGSSTSAHHEKFGYGLFKRIHIILQFCRISYS